MNNKESETNQAGDCPNSVNLCPAGQFGKMLAGQCAWVAGTGFTVER